MMIGARTAAWANSGGSILTARDYVQDGLWMQFDGIENVGYGLHDNSSFNWIDLVSGKNLPVAFYGMMRGTWKDNAFNLDGNASDQLRFDNKTLESFTVEICVRTYEYNQCLIHINGNYAFGFLVGIGGSESNKSWTNYFGGSLGYSFGGNSVAFKNETHTMAYRASPTESKICRDVTDDVKTKSYTATSSPIFNQMNIGNYSSEKAHCDYHSIRIYDRYLTDAEIAANYEIDKVRFNLL